MAKSLPLWTWTDPKHMDLGIWGSSDKSWQSSPSSLNATMLENEPGIPPNTTILLWKLTAAKFLYLAILSLRGRSLQAAFCSTSRLSIEFRSRSAHWRPQKQNALIDLRRTLPDKKRAVLRGAIPTHLLVIALYFSQIWQAPLFHPPIAIKREDSPLNEMYHPFWAIRLSVVLLPVQSKEENSGLQWIRLRIQPELTKSFRFIKNREEAMSIILSNLMFSFLREMRLNRWPSSLSKKCSFWAFSRCVSN